MRDLFSCAGATRTAPLRPLSLIGRPNDKHVVPAIRRRLPVNRLVGGDIRSYGLEVEVRVAIVSDFYLDYVGGLQSSLVEQQTALTDAGHEVSLVSMGRRASPTASGAHLQVKPSWTVPGVLLPVTSATDALIGRLERHFRTLRTEVVHLQTEFALAHAATTAAARLGIPVVHTVHTFYWQSTGIGPVLATPIMRYGLSYVMRRRIPNLPLAARPPDRLLRNVTLAMALRADAVVSPSAHQAADLRAAGITAPVVEVPNPIARSPRPPRELTLDRARRPRVLWVGRCEPEKRPLVFLAAALEASARTSAGFEVDIVGDGSDLPAIRRLAAGHPSVRVHGALPHERVIELMDEAALVVLTSDGFDNQPMTIAEATTRYRGVLYCDPKLREGLAHSGLLTDAPDASSIADALTRVVGDPDRLIALSVGARRDSATFSGPRYVERILDVYRAAAAMVG